MKLFLKRVAGLVLISFFVVTLFPDVALAIPYGQGNYGSGKYGQGESGSSNQSSNSTGSTNPGCNQPQPGLKTPWIYGAIAQDRNSILLYFTDADDPVDHYALEFGTESGDYKWSATDIGGKGVGTYLVESLSPSTKYYFRIRAGNGCATGEWSDEISASTKSLFAFNQLKITNFEPKSLREEKEKTSGSTAMDIESNHEDVGGITVKIKVIDEDGKSTSGVKVILHSDPKEALTDENGVATFNNVESGEHRIIVDHDGQRGEQTMSLSGEAEEYFITVQMESSGFKYSFLQVAGIVFLSIAVFSLILFLWGRWNK